MCDLFDRLSPGQYNNQSESIGQCPDAIAIAI